MPVEYPEEILDGLPGSSNVSESELGNAQKDPQPSRARRVYAKPQVKPRVSVAEKKDVQGKISMLLLPPAAIWGRYDEYCGSAFAQVIPQLSADLAEIFADNAEIMAWFASGAGWMKYLKLLNTLQPVGEMMWAHHVAHTVGEVKNKDGYAPPANAREWDTTYIVPTQQQARTVPSADSLNRG
jgi:hypothetical protein